MSITINDAALEEEIQLVVKEAWKKLPPVDKHPDYSFPEIKVRCEVESMPQYQALVKFKMVRDANEKSWAYVDLELTKRIDPKPSKKEGEKKTTSS